MFVFWGFVCAPHSKVSHPPRWGEGVEGQGETAGPAGNALGGTAGCCCSHGNQGGRGQVTESEEEREKKKIRRGIG